MKNIQESTNNQSQYRVKTTSAGSGRKVTGASRSLPRGAGDRSKGLEQELAALHSKVK